MVRVTANGFKFEGIPPNVKGPNVFFEMKNGGPTQHQLELVRAPQGERIGGTEALAVGQSTTLALRLPPGQYLARCMVKLADTPHADLGMVAELHVQ